MRPNNTPQKNYLTELAILSVITVALVITTYNQQTQMDEMAVNFDAQLSVISTKYDNDIIKVKRALNSTLDGDVQNYINLSEDFVKLGRAVKKTNSQTVKLIDNSVIKFKRDVVELSSNSLEHYQDITTLQGQVKTLLRGWDALNKNDQTLAKRIHKLERANK